MTTDYRKIALERLQKRVPGTPKNLGDYALARAILELMHWVPANDVAVIERFAKHKL